MSLTEAERDSLDTCECGHWACNPSHRHTWTDTPRRSRRIDMRWTWYGLRDAQDAWRRALTTPTPRNLMNTASNPRHGTTVAWWLLTGPWHPLWTQFAICVVHLRDTPGLPPAELHYPGATHELLVMALDPSHVHTPEGLANSQPLHYLRPLDFVHQFTATDDEMRELARCLANACAAGQLTPSTDDNRTHYREQWLTSCLRTLAHIRGEEHAP